MRRRAGFTLVELLAVIAIISILIALITYAVIKALTPTKKEATWIFMQSLGSACGAYRINWGDYPPSDLKELGGEGLNDLNNGVEALTACLASEKRGEPKHYEENKIDNIDGDSAGTNITQWRYGDTQLREIVDEWGHPLAYFHHRDYVGKNPRVLKYKLSKDAEPVEVRPLKNLKTNTWYGPGSFQILSAGEDGKFGTEDDVVVSP